MFHCQFKFPEADPSLNAVDFARKKQQTSRRRRSSQINNLNLGPIPSGWWYTYPSEKWWSSPVGMIIPNIWKNKKCSAPPTRWFLWSILQPRPAETLILHSPHQLNSLLSASASCTTSCRKKYRVKRWNGPLDPVATLSYPSLKENSKCSSLVECLR